MKKVILFIIIATITLIFLFPVYWMILSSFRTNPEIFSTQLNLFPTSLTTENYVNLIQNTSFVRWMINSIIVTVSTTVLGLIFSTFAGYALAKYNFFAKNIIFIIVLLMMIVPHHITIIPIFKLMASLNLTNTYWSLILPFSANALAVFLMRQYIKGIPDDIIESARIDGCNELRIVFSIIIPVVKPALVVGGLAIFIMSWNDFLFPLVMMTGEDRMLFTVGLSSLKTFFRIEYGMIMAGSFISILPMLALLLLSLKQFIEGLTAGAVKG